MVDWKAMYLESVRAMEQAIQILVQAQQTCEEIYIRAGEKETGKKDCRGKKNPQFPENSI